MSRDSLLLLSVETFLTVYSNNLMMRRCSPSLDWSRSSSSSLASFGWHSYSHLFASLGVASECELIWFCLINLHVFPLHGVILGLLLQLTCQFISIALLDTMLLVNLYQTQLLCIFSWRRLFSCRQSSFVVKSWLSFNEQIEPFIVKVVNLLVLAREAQSSEELVNASETHDFILDGVVGGLYAAIFLFERLLNDAACYKRYLAVSLQRIFMPSIKAWEPLSFSIWSRIGSTLS